MRSEPGAYQGIYRFDDELLRALAETPLDISLPASLLTRLPEWAMYVETQGFRHHGKPIVGMIATLFDAPSGLSLMLTLIPETVRSIDDDLDRLQFHLTETSLRERLLRDIGDHGTRSAEFRETLDELAKAGAVPHEKIAEFEENVTDTMRQFALDAILTEIVPFISVLLYLASDEPDIEHRPAIPVGTSTKRGVRFFAPDHPQGVAGWCTSRRGPASSAHRLRQHPRGRSRGTATLAKSPLSRVLAWQAQRRSLRLRWLMPVAVNIKPGDALPAVVHPVQE
jgi:hypothetical protein